MVTQFKSVLRNSQSNLLQDAIGGHTLGLVDDQDAVYVTTFASSTQAFCSGSS